MTEKKSDTQKVRLSIFIYLWLSKSVEMQVLPVIISENIYKNL